MGSNIYFFTSQGEKQATDVMSSNYSGPQFPHLEVRHCVLKVVMRIRSDE